MEIVTPRLRLVPVDMKFLDTTYAYAGDLENTCMMMYLPFLSLEETAESIEDAVAQWNSPEPDRLEFAILLGAEHIGGMTLYFLPDRSNAELGWVVHKEHWGRGYVTEAAIGLMKYAAQNLGVVRIIACCDSENIASRRVMEKLGMKYHSTGKRKNRSSGDEERIELTYETFL